MDRSLLRKILTEYWSESEIRTLSFDLAVDYEILPGDSKQDKVRELIGYMERNARLPALIEKAYQQRPNAPWPEAPDSSPETFTWQTLLDHARAQGEKFLREAQGTPQRPNIFIPAVYTRRTAVEEALKTFLTGPATALILLGDPGVGKTNVLCRWALDLAAENHVVFYYDCGGSIQLDIEQDIARDLGLDGPAQLISTLRESSALADLEKCHFVLIFDAVNEFHHENQAGAGALLKRIDALVGRLPESRIRVVLSCRTATWQQLERQNATRLLWHRYFHVGQESYLKLGMLDTQEFAALYERYCTYFQLQTPFSGLPAALRDRLRNPLLLRMLAEAYRDRRKPIAHEGLFLGIFQRYYEERVRRLPDRLFLKQLVIEMLARQRIALSLEELAAHPQLGPEIVKDTPDASYRRLLEEGVLSEISGGPSTGSVRFTYDQVGAYALAGHLLNQPEDGKELISRLVHENRDFPLAWETARILLLLRRETALFAQMAQSADVELREIAIHALAEMHADDPTAATNIIKHLLELHSPEAQRTGLKTAYTIGAGTRDLFLWAATQDRPGLRRATKDILYLIWRTDPDFTFSLLQELSTHIQLTAIFNLRLILEFILDLTITIYINHCDQPELAHQTSDLYYVLAKERLHLDWLDVGILGPTFEKLIFRAISSAVAQPILETFEQTELATLEHFVRLAEDERARLKRVLYLLEPGSDLKPAAADLHHLLVSETPFFNVVAGLALASHAYRDFAATVPLLQQLFEELNAHGRLWLLQSFAVLLQDTPPAWIELLETFTRRLVAENPDTFYQEQKGFLAHFDIELMPLGLAYGKQGLTMPYFEELIRQHVAAGNWPHVKRCLAGLGPVGFYYPQAILTTLQAAIPDFNDPRLQEALVPPLSMMRLLHLDEVDIFLQQIGTDETFKRRVVAAASLEALSRYIYRLGVYNHSIRAAAYSPKIRRNFIMGGFEVLIDTSDPQQYIAYYTATAVRMAREAGYRLIEWTMPD